MNSNSLFVINNLTGNQSFNDSLPEFVYQTVVSSLSRSNSGEYSEALVQKMINDRSVEKIKDKLGSACFIYIQDDECNIAAFAAIEKCGEEYFYCWLQVLPGHQGRGLAQKLCAARDVFVRENQIKSVYIKSLVYERTLAFHAKQGFKICGDQSGLNVTVRMNKKF